MDKKTEYVSQITNFPPLSPETNESGVSVLFSKFFKFARSSPTESTESQNTVPADGTAQDVGWKDISRDENKETTENLASGQYSEDYAEGRSLQNVLRRISSLVALKSSSGTRYADTERARYWMPDSVSRECYDCGARFSAFRRRHHCRVCGQIFCARCCSHRVPGHVCGCAGGLRVCTYCCRVVLSYLQSVEGGAPLSADLKAFQDNLKDHIPKEPDLSPEQGFLGGTRDGGPGNDGDSSLSRLDTLQDTFRLLCASLPFQQHRYRLVRYPGVWRGGEIIQWLIDHRNVQTRIQATEICQSMLSEGLLECVTEQQTFIDYALYKSVTTSVQGTNETSREQDPMSGSTSSYCLNLNVSESSARLVKGHRKDSKVVTNAVENEKESSLPLDSETTEEIPTCCTLVEGAGAEHLRLLLEQGLARASLSLTWAPILLPLCQQAAHMVTPDITGSEWDIRSCVRVKRVSGGCMRESRTVGGVVFSKNVAHRGMPARLNAPRLLLLRCSIVYQRVEGKLVSLEPVIMQEKDYLRHCCARVLALQPEVVLVQGSVSRLAQDELRLRGVTLVLNVRASVMQRVARATGADIVTSVDAHIGRPKLGLCKSFYLLNYDSKTLMVLEGYGSDLKGCSIILRGAPLEELGRVKQVTSLILLAAYNWRLESSFLGDLGATLPVSHTQLMFTDNSKDSSPEQDDEVPIEEKFFEDFEKKQENLPALEKVNTTEKKEEETADQGCKETKLCIAMTDPLTTDTFLRPNSRKLEGPSLSCGITVNDFSDPLRSRQLSIDDEVFLPHIQAEKDHDTQDLEELDTLRNRWSSDESVLSMSPHVRICAPYLESEAGRRCNLRHYFCSPLFPRRPAPPTPRPLHRVRRHSFHPGPQHLQHVKVHPFISKALVNTAEDTPVRALLAHYRAVGGHKNESYVLKMNREVSEEPKKVGEGPSEILKVAKGTKDPLDPEQHQRMYLLYYSYSSRSTNAPDFCVNPWIVRMEMYGPNDISLGQFLERHCFTQYSCSSPNCQIPLMNHVRKFVHGDGCITVTCGTVDSSSTLGTTQRLPTEYEGKQSVMWWCRCMLCREGGEGGGGSGGGGLRAPSLALSLAKYLELRFHASRYTRTRACGHSLHQHHSHYFASGNTTACFKYSKIKSWDICLPPANIATQYNTRAIRDALINQVNDLVYKGHEVFLSIGEGDAEKEQASFKQHVEQIQLNLTSSIIQSQSSGAGVVRWLWNISDALVVGEKMLQESLENWTTQTPAKTVFKMPQEIVDGKVDSDDSTQPDFNAVDCAADNRGLSTSSLEVEHLGEEEEDKGDKKGLRAMLSQLLSNSQPAHQSGVVLCGGVVPVVVLPGEVSSLAAAALASLQYHHQLQAAPNTKGAAVESEEKENGTPTNKDKTESEGKSKSSKNTDDIDVQLQDGLFCRVYNAVQFLKLRAMLLCPLQLNPHIVNDFVFKAPDTNDSENTNKEEKKSDIIPNLLTDQINTCKDSEVDHTIIQNPLAVNCDRDTSVNVESSPILGAKKVSDDKAKKMIHGKLATESLSEIEESFIRSLSRCVPWAARGGKSGSTFCKTRDDRFILKEMSKLEVQLFVDLAPHYFNYITHCHQNKYPTLIGRIVGVYRVDGVGGVGGGVLVMENLWHSRAELAGRFDLKGAERNRLAEHGSPDVVLLDENLLKLRWESPLFLQSHSAGVLWAAVQRDTAFLAAHHVMDYSLLVGLDEEREELVLGIIDYIRTFTWDKKLEHIVKKGLGSGLPTIVSPEQYKARFCNAMKKYFLQSPNQWEDLDRGLIADIN